MKTIGKRRREDPFTLEQQLPSSLLKNYAESHFFYTQTKHISRPDDLTGPSPSPPQLTLQGIIYDIAVKVGRAVERAVYIYMYVFFASLVF